MTFRSSLSTARRTRRILLQQSAALGALLVTGKLWAQPPAPVVRVAAAYPVPVGQQWVSCIHKALATTEDRGEIDYTYSENISLADYEAALRQYGEQGMHLIVGEAFHDEALTRQIALDYPDTAFLMGSSGRPQHPNFSVFNSYIEEPTYLTGMIAGGLTQTGIIGLVGAHPTGNVNRLMHAFMDGVYEINPDAQFLISFTNSRFDPRKARQTAFAMIDRGADVLYAERVGVAEAAKQRGKLVIGNIIDSQRQFPDTVVASALWDMAPTIERALTMVKRGTFHADDYGKYSQMRYEGAMFAPSRTLEGKLPGALLARVQARHRTILDGSFTIKLNDKPLTATNLAAIPLQTSGK